MSRMVTQVMRVVAPLSVRHVRPVTAAREGLLGRVYASMAADGVPPVPPLIVHAADPEVMAGFWLFAREAWLAGPTSRPAREAVAAGVSEANQCPFCVEVHRTALRASRSPELAHLAWGRATARAGSPGLAIRPFPADATAQFVGTAVAFHYLNRVVEVLATDSPFPAVVSRMGPVGRYLGERTLGSELLSIRPEPGRHADLLPPEQLPADLAWAEQNSAVAAALAKFIAAVDRAALRIPPATRELLADHLRGWDGTAPGPNRSWSDEAVRPLCAAERPGARLALVIALAPWQVDDSLVEAYRSTHPADAALLGLVSVSALATALRISAWI